MLLTRKRIPLRLNASQYLVGGFVVLILVGALLLNLPQASVSGESAGFINALFTSTSAACVTGQVVVNTAAQWSWFGRLVIITLIQIGGIGVVTLVAIAMRMLKLTITMRERMTIGAAFGQDEVGGMERLIVNVIKVTLAAEIAGAVFLTIGFYTAQEIPVSFGRAVKRHCHNKTIITTSSDINNPVLQCTEYSGSVSFWEFCIPAQSEMRR